jgi:hypothetical protein
MNIAYETKEVYVCKSCKKQYSTADAAEQCYKRDTLCICERTPDMHLGNYIYLFFKCAGCFCQKTEKYVGGCEYRKFDVKNSAILRDVQQDIDHPVREIVMTISHCPFCGRKLPEVPDNCADCKLERTW